MEKAIKKRVFSQETNKTQLRIINKIQNKINKQLTCVVGFGGWLGKGKEVWGLSWKTQVEEEGEEEEEEAQKKSAMRARAKRAKQIRKSFAVVDVCFPEGLTISISY